MSAKEDLNMDYSKYDFKDSQSFTFTSARRVSQGALSRKLAR